MNHISKEIDKLLVTYEHILILGDFNSPVSEIEMKGFCELYDLQNLIKEPTCYKNVNNPSSIDVMLTNRNMSFQNTMVIETGLSDHHKMTVTVLKTYFQKKDPIIINYRCYKHLNEFEFRNDLVELLESFENKIMDYDDFNEIFLIVLDKYAPLKEKVLRGNNAPFMNKILSKAIMHRSFTLATTIPLKKIWGWLKIFFLQEKRTSVACLRGSGLNSNFH